MPIMADDSGKRSRTQQMEIVSAPGDAKAPGKSVGKRSFNAGEARGLAAFDKASGAAPPAPKKPGAPGQDDADLRAARLEASHAHDDDDMVPTSRSHWGDIGESPARGKGRAAAAEAPEEDEAEAAPRKGSSAWKWIGGTLLLGAVGVGGWFGVSALQSPAPPSPSEPSAATRPKPMPEEAADDEPAADEPAAKPDAPPANETPTPAAIDKKPSEQPATSAPASWAPAVEASNPWVTVTPAPADRVLGLTPSEASDERAATRTGLRPEARLMAPQRTYRIASHEVTWGELAKADTLAEVTSLTRPKWLPGDVAKQAQLPATGVPWKVAQAFCHGLGGDLPSEAEWEWAARGPDALYLPWGRDAFTMSEVHTVATGRVPVVPVKTSKLDRTPGASAIYDLLGNAQEWTRDAWRPADPSAPADPRAATHKAIRGWPLADPGANIPSEGSTYRAPGCADPSCLTSDGAALERVGFRCVRDGG